MQASGVTKTYDRLLFYLPEFSTNAHTDLVCTRPWHVAPLAYPAPLPTIKNYELYFDFLCQVWVLIEAFQVLIEAVQF